jgi:asparagine synthase (glutamine-hydrolysing)
VGDSVMELIRAGAATKFDDAAIAVFLRLGYFIGDDTPFESVRAFPVGGVLRWSLAGGLNVTGAKPGPGLDSAIGKREALQGYVDRFRSAVSRSLPADQAATVLPLSGGRDSRHIAFEMHRCGFRPGLVISQRHFASRSNEDARVAALLTEALGWTLTTSDQASAPLQSEHEKNRIFESMTQEHAWFLPTARQIRAGNYSAVFDGIAGDVLSNGLFCRAAWQAKYDASQWPDLFRAMGVSGAPDGAITAVLAPEFAKRWSFEAGLARWKAELDVHSHEDDPISRFKFWNRTRRCIAPFAQRYLQGLDIHMPYLDTDVADHLLSLPRRHFESRDFHDEAIALAAPQFAHIPYESKTIEGDLMGHQASLLRSMAKSPRYWRSTSLNQNWLRPRLVAALVSRAAARRVGWVASAAAAAHGIESLAAMA